MRPPPRARSSGPIARTPRNGPRRFVASTSSHSVRLDLEQVAHDGAGRAVDEPPRLSGRRRGRPPASAQPGVAAHVERRRSPAAAEVRRARPRSRPRAADPRPRRRARAPQPVTSTALTRARRAGWRRSRRPCRRARPAGSPAPGGRTCAGARPSRSASSQRRPSRSPRPPPITTPRRRAASRPSRSRRRAPRPPPSSRSRATASPASSARSQIAAREGVPATLALQVEEDRLALPRLAARPLLERAAAGVGLDAAAQAAVAAAAARLDAHVADLPRRAAPVDEAPVEDEPARRPRCPRRRRGRSARRGPRRSRRSASTATLTSLPDRDGHAQTLGERRTERERLVPPVDVRHLDDGTRCGVDRSRCTDADAVPAR